MPKRKRGPPKKPAKKIDQDAMVSDSDEMDDSDRDSVNMDFPSVGLHSDDEQEEVLPIHSDDDDDESENDDYDDTNNVEAWGKRKANFFNADFVDEDRGRSYREEDQENAKAEEIDALEIQRRFLDNIHSAAYDTKSFMMNEPVIDESKSLATTDWNAIKKTDKMQVLNKQSPELVSIMQNFKEKLIELKKHKPQSFKEFENSNKHSKKNTKLMHLKSQILLHYTMNLSFYMAVRAANNTSLQNPVMKKVKDFETLLHLVEEMEKREESMHKLQKTAQLKKPKHVQFSDVPLENVIDDNLAEDDETQAEDKRLISYQIAKNKGLLPRRKKEYRNPRLKHRIKFKKALIKRKGQVRTPRTEMERYGGETSGIHANVTKSVKFK